MESAWGVNHGLVSKTYVGRGQFKPAREILEIGGKDKLKAATKSHFRARTKRPNGNSWGTVQGTKSYPAPFAATRNDRLKAKKAENIRRIAQTSWAKLSPEEKAARAARTGNPERLAAGRDAYYANETPAQKASRMAKVRRAKKRNYDRPVEL